MVVVERDLDVKKFREINKLAETKAQFQNMMDYVCTTLGISLPLPPHPCSGNKIKSLPRQEHIRINQEEVHRVDLSGPSYRNKCLENARVKNTTQEAPKSHYSEGRSITSNSTEAPKSQAEGLIHGNLRYSLTARC